MCYIHILLHTYILHVLSILSVVRVYYRMRVYTTQICVPRRLDILQRLYYFSIVPVQYEYGTYGMYGTQNSVYTRIILYNTVYTELCTLAYSSAVVLYVVLYIL